MSVSDDFDYVVIIGIALLVAYGLYKAGQLVNEAGTAIQTVESYL